MKNIRRWPLYFLLMLLLQVFGSSVSGQVREDSAKPDLRKFSSEQLTRFRNDDAFKYRLVAEPPASLWERFWTWFWHRVSRILATRSGQVTLKIVVYAAAAFLIALFVFQLRRMNASGLFGSVRADKLRYVVSDDDINSIDFEAELARALEAGDHRLAIRLYYLSTLKNLSERSLIDWQIDKTNISYVNELPANSMKEKFRFLTASFEKHWYGNIAVTPEEFEEVRIRFSTFNAELKA